MSVLGLFKTFLGRYGYTQLHIIRITTFLMNHDHIATSLRHETSTELFDGIC